MLTEGINRSLLFSPGFVARRVKRPWIRGARGSASKGVLGHYVEHGGGALWAAQQSRRGLARCDGKLGRKAGQYISPTSCVTQFRSLLADIGWAPDRKSDRMLV